MFTRSQAKNRRTEHDFLSGRSWRCGGFFCFMGCCVIVAPGTRRTVSCPGCWWIPGAVPLSSRKNAKGGEQGTQLACGSNKCPLPSNAFSRKPRGSHAPEIRHPGQEMVLRWGMEGARGKGRDPAMGSEKNGQLCRKCGKVCRIRCTLGKLGGILILYSGISKSARKSGGNDMRKWKSCLLLAVGMSAACQRRRWRARIRSDMVSCGGEGV